MFEVGDRVRCIDPVLSLRYGEVYTVTSTTPYDCVHLNNEGYGWYFTRFEKVEPMFDDNDDDNELETAGVFMVYNATNRGTPRVTHNSFEDAKNEANRLATATPNCEFMVLEATYSVKRVPQYTTEEKTFNITH